MGVKGEASHVDIRDWREQGEQKGAGGMLMLFEALLMFHHTSTAEDVNRMEKCNLLLDSRKTNFKCKIKTFIGGYQR